MVYKRKNGAGLHGRNTTASPAQALAWRTAKPGDTIRILLRSGNVARFTVCKWPEEFRPEPGAMCIYGQKAGQGPNSPIRRIAAFELVVE